MTDLTDDRLRHFASQLDQRARQLRGEIDGVQAEQDGDPPNQVEDQGERGEQRIREAVRHAEQDRDVDELRDIEAARSRLAAGSYGLCVDCGVDIPVARLDAQPWAARCLPCQERYEQSHPVGVRIPPMQ